MFVLIAAALSAVFVALAAVRTHIPQRGDLRYNRLTRREVVR
jgi:hypothetical protein